MNLATIICPHCKNSFGISDAIQHQIEDELQRAKSEQSETLRKEYDVRSEMKINEAVQNAIVETKNAAEIQLTRERQAAMLEIEKAKQSAELELEKAKQSTELETERLRLQAESAKENETQLREQLKGLFEDLSKANKAREDAELTARKELLEKEKFIREEATQRASDNFNTKIREQEEIINKLREQLTTAKQVPHFASARIPGPVAGRCAHRVLPALQLAESKPTH